MRHGRASVVVAMILPQRPAVMQSHASRLIVLGMVLASRAASAEEQGTVPPNSTADSSAPTGETSPAGAGENRTEVPPTNAPPAAAPHAGSAPIRLEAAPLPPRNPTPEPPVERVPTIPLLPPPPVFPSLRQHDDRPSLAGIEDGRVFVRDATGRLQLFPSARVSLDLNATPGAPDLGTSSEDARGLGTAFFVRRATFELRGELGARLAFTVGIELGGGRIGTTEYSGPATPRIAMASAHAGRVLPADATVSYRFRRWLNLTAGQQLLPFSMSNRTPEWAHALPERPLAVRAFAVPWHRDLGLTVWGEAAPKEYLHYELGVFGGDGYEHVFADALPEFVGRIYTRPLAGLGAGSALEGAQLGVSARVGSRAPERVTYDYPTVSTAQGWVLWQPGYEDSLGRTTRVLPSGLQRAVGGELRLPIRLPGGSALDLQGEAYFVENDTREAVVDFVATNTERFGRLQGVGWYGQLSYWCCGDPFANGTIGEATPRRVELGGEASPNGGPPPAGVQRRTVPRGLELVAIASGINANYDGATRVGSTKDSKTPRSNVNVYQLGVGGQYWFGRNFRGGLHYSAYVVPNAGTIQNLAVVPSNVPDQSGAVNAGNSSHELTLRLQAGF